MEQSIGSKGEADPVCHGPLDVWSPLRSTASPSCRKRFTCFVDWVREEFVISGPEGRPTILVRNGAERGKEGGREGKRELDGRKRDVSGALRELT